MPSRHQEQLTALRQLAQLYGIQTSYVDMGGQHRQASPEALRQVLGSLEPALEEIEDPREALEERRLAFWRRRAEPVAVAWDGKSVAIDYNLPAHHASEPIEFTLRREDGELLHGSFSPEQLETVRAATILGHPFEAKRFHLPAGLPYGYHQLTLRQGSMESEQLLISAPSRAFEPAETEAHNPWGVFLPLYSLHTERSWGAGDLGDFARLVDWAKGQGASVTASLPLLTAFLDDQPFNPSPYVPASRLFWNEFYIDIEQAPELAHCPAARELLASTAFQATVRELRASPLVDYRRQWELKRLVLSELARTFFAADANAPRRQELARFLAANPRVEDYAAFRAACCRHGSWYTWPTEMREGELTPNDYAQADKQLYLYAQWLVQEQMDRLADQAREAGPGLYLDLPLGVHPDSYDVWREPASFAQGVCGGAPPDAFFIKGQNWGFQPLHPLHMRERHYSYMRTCFGQLLRQAGVLRIDHVMGLHRLFWVPEGMEASEGLYVQYHQEELFALLSVESHRHRSVIVGEDLGTVSDQFRRELGQHNIHRMYVMQFSFTTDPKSPIRPVTKDSVASLNTHDMPTFAGFWHECDIDDQVDLGLLDEAQERESRQQRAAIRHALTEYFRNRPDAGDPDLDHGLEEFDQAAIIARVTAGTLKHLANSSAKMVLVTLEDLWQELAPQNVPGTTEALRPNWQHRARYSLEEFAALPAVQRLLSEINALRNQSHTPRKTKTSQEVPQ